MLKNTDQNNSEYGHSLRSVDSFVIGFNTSSPDYVRYHQLPYHIRILSKEKWSAAIERKGSYERHMYLSAIEKEVRVTIYFNMFSE